MGPLACVAAPIGMGEDRNSRRVMVGGVPRRLYACDVGGEEVDPVAVEVSSGTVVVFGGSRVGVPGEDLGVPQRDASVEGVGDRGVAQRVRADVSGDRCGPGDALDHPVHVTSINRLAGERTQDEGSGAPLASACLKDS